MNSQSTQWTIISNLHVRWIIQSSWSVTKPLAKCKRHKGSGSTRIKKNKDRHPSTKKFLNLNKHKTNAKTMKSEKSMKKIHTSNHIRCYSYLLDCQLECLSLHHGSLHLSLTAISNPQCGWCGCRHCSPRQSREIGLLMACLIAVETYQCSTRAILTKMSSLTTPKTEPIARQARSCGLSHFPQCP